MGGVVQKPIVQHAQQATPASSTPALYDRTYDGLYRLDAAGGKKLWYASIPLFTTAHNENYTSSPAFIWKDSVYIMGTYNDGYYLYAFDADNGFLRWKYRYGGAELHINDEQYPGAVLFGSGTVYIVASSDHMATSGPHYMQGGVIVPLYPSILYALNPMTGSLQWKRLLGYQLNDPVFNDGNIYGIGSTTTHGAFYALRGSDGSILWQQPLAQTASIFFSLQADSGSLYYVALDDKSVLLAARSMQDGRVLWQIHEPAHGSSGEITVANGLLYYIVNSQDLYAFRSQNGALLWKRTMPGIDRDAIVLVNSGRIYLLVQVDSIKSPVKLLALNASSGHEDWMQGLPQSVISGATRLYVSRDRLYLYVPTASTDKIFIFSRTTGTLITSYELPVMLNLVMGLGQLTLQP